MIKKNTVQLHDIIGTHSGVHYYLETFKKILLKHKINASVCSNYDFETDRAFYPNIYHGNIIVRLYNLFLTYTLFMKTIYVKNYDGYIIISFYGSIIELPMLVMSILKPGNVIIDFHEIHLKTRFSWFYKLIYHSVTNQCIVHSSVIETAINDHCPKAKVAFLPHLNYDTPNHNQLTNVEQDVIDACDVTKKIFLYFGHIRESKGIHYLLQEATLLNDLDGVTVIIAGQDTNNLLLKYHSLVSQCNHIHIINRFINDDEMQYLFSFAHYILLPYNEISQSGVWEMAFQFRKPILASKLQYFESIISMCPSFGHIINVDERGSLFKFIRTHSHEKSPAEYYSNKDIETYIVSKNYSKHLLLLINSIWPLRD